ncbi:MAG TPA: LacI family DNA-binding transcriptional regulator [Anaeromyxobacteraceae bacterium]|nr:LacI family DNA-binding transcriptional regulator [Anaeromyxobacteraceae bacterium]
MATMVEVARRARVSTSTVSHVVNGTRFVSPAARDRVQEAIGALGYRPNALARSLRVGQSHTLGLVVPDSANPFFAEVGRAVEQAAFAAGFSVILCNTENDAEREERYLTVLARKQVDGIVLVAAGERGGAARSLARSGVPVVAMDRERRGIAVDTVVADHRLGGRLATSHLARLGHRRIACVAGPARLSPSALRVAGYRDALREADLPLDPALLVHGDFRPAGAAAAARALLASARPPSAVFACNDLMALGVLSAAAAAGRRVPADLAVVGYDDIELAAFTAPPLTTVVQPRRELGRAIVDLLLDRTRHRERAARRVVLPVELRIRASCGAVVEARAARSGAARSSGFGSPTVEGGES